MKVSLSTQYVLVVFRVNAVVGFGVLTAVGLQSIAVHSDLVHYTLTDGQFVASFSLIKMMLQCEIINICVQVFLDYTPKMGVSG